MKPQKALFLLALFTLLILGANASFNYWLDAKCYYHCTVIDKERPANNSYYQVAQRILTYPETEVILLASSRGETTLPVWIEQMLHQKTLNLAVAGAEINTKKAFLKMAIENTAVTKVIWFADYFEWIDESRDEKLHSTIALRKYIDNFPNEKSTNWISTLPSLIDYKTTSASIDFFKHRPLTQQTQGGREDVTLQQCLDENYPGKESAEGLKTKINILYQNYMDKVLKPPQNQMHFAEFKELVASLKQKNIQLLVVIIPYHPLFLKRLKSEHPELHESHKKWASQMQSLSGHGIKVIDNYEGFPGDDGSPKYWNDGVHFTCQSTIIMLQEVLKSWSQSSF